MALKQKNLSGFSGAALLPNLMHQTASPIENAEQLAVWELEPASESWNFYSPLSDDKMLELIESIAQNGLLHPIVVWRRKGMRDMVLSGHNRLRAYRRLYEVTNNDVYSRIAATVKQGISEQQAREIIVDSNWVQRTLSPSEKARSVSQKYALAGRKTRGRNGDAHQSTYDLIAKEYGLSGRQIARYVKLGKLENELLILLDNAKLPLAAGLKLADIPPRLQKAAAQWIEQYGITPSQTAKIHKEINETQLKELLLPQTHRPPKTVVVKTEVPAALQAEFCRMVQSWLKERQGDV